MWQLVAADLAGNKTAFLDDVAGFKITPTINGYAEIKGALNPLDAAAAEILIGKRSIRAYQDGVLRFCGKVWEPLSKGSQGVSFTARDPLAEFMLRRVRAQIDYTATNNLGGPWDAGQIAYDRLAAQNALRNTYLAAGTRQASTNRIRTAAIGNKEGDFLDELAGASGGFFFKARPTDSVAGSMALLDILYPNAGTTREEVRLGYGTATLDNLADYEQVEMLPLNRMTTASSASTGGRISKAAENATSVADFGLFEDETTYSDVTDVNLLQQQSDASLKPTPPLAYTLTPGLDAPLLFTEFNVGDFVRLNIKHGSVDFFAWVRVLSATLDVSPEGIESLSSILVEVLVGDQLTVHPDELYLAQRDDERRRLEALERRVENLSVSSGTPTGSGAPSGGTTETPPTDPGPPPPPPPPAPSDPPGVAMSQALAQYGEFGSPFVDLTGVATPFGQSTWAGFEIFTDVGNAPGSLYLQTSTQNVDPPDSNLHRYDLRVPNLAKGTKYWVRARAGNASGESRSSFISFTTPSVRVF